MVRAVTSALGDTAGQVRVWDALVRVFHWTLVVAFAVAYLSEDEFMTLHAWAGYTVLALLAIRVVWGFVGSRHARFGDFVYSWPRVRDYLSELLAFRPSRYLGHNPAGGWMVVALLVALFVTGASGLVAWGAGEGAGPLAGLLAGSPRWLAKVLEEVHEFLANLTLFLIVIHIAGVVVDSLLHRENLVRAMVTGYKKAVGESPSALRDPR